MAPEAEFAINLSLARSGVKNLSPSRPYQSGRCGGEINATFINQSLHVQLFHFQARMTIFGICFAIQFTISSAML